MKSVNEYKPGLMLQTLFSSSEHARKCEYDYGTYIYLGIDEKEDFFEPPLIVFCVDCGEYDYWCYGAKIVETDFILAHFGKLKDEK